MPVTRNIKFAKDQNTNRQISEADFFFADMPLHCLIWGFLFSLPSIRDAPGSVFRELKNPTAVRKEYFMSLLNWFNLGGKKKEAAKPPGMPVTKNPATPAVSKSVPTPLPSASPQAQPQAVQRKPIRLQQKPAILPATPSPAKAPPVSVPAAGVPAAGTTVAVAPVAPAIPRETAPTAPKNLKDIAHIFGSIQSVLEPVQTRRTILKIPCSIVLSKLPEALRGPAWQAGNYPAAEVSIDRDKMLAQLKTGHLAFPLGEFINDIPPGWVFPSPPETLLEFDLHQIVAVLPPHLLPEAAAQPAPAVNVTGGHDLFTPKNTQKTVEKNIPFTSPNPLPPNLFAKKPEAAPSPAVIAEPAQPGMRTLTTQIDAIQSILGDESAEMTAIPCAALLSKLPETLRGPAWESGNFPADKLLLKSTELVAKLKTGRIRYPLAIFLPMLPTGWVQHQPDIEVDLDLPQVVMAISPDVIQGSRQKSKEFIEAEKMQSLFAAKRPMPAPAEPLSVAPPAVPAAVPPPAVQTPAAPQMVAGPPAIRSAPSIRPVVRLNLTPPATGSAVAQSVEQPPPVPVPPPAMPVAAQAPVTPVAPATEPPAVPTDRPESKQPGMKTLAKNFGAIQSLLGGETENTVSVPSAALLSKLPPALRGPEWKEGGFPATQLVLDADELVAKLKTGRIRYPLATLIPMLPTGWVREEAGTEVDLDLSLVVSAIPSNVIQGSRQKSKEFIEAEKMQSLFAAKRPLPSSVPVAITSITPVPTPIAAPIQPPAPVVAQEPVAPVSPVAPQAVAVPPPVPTAVTPTPPVPTPIAAPIQPPAPVVAQEPVAPVSPVAPQAAEVPPPSKPQPIAVEKSEMDEDFEAFEKMVQAEANADVQETVKVRGPKNWSGRENSLTAPFGVDINTATMAELEAVPGIGPSRAMEIIQSRETSGPFNHIYELAGLTGVGHNQFRQMTGLSLSTGRNRYETLVKLLRTGKVERLSMSAILEAASRRIEADGCVLSGIDGVPLARTASMNDPAKVEHYAAISAQLFRRTGKYLHTLTESDIDCIHLPTATPALLLFAIDSFFFVFIQEKNAFSGRSIKLGHGIVTELSWLFSKRAIVRDL